MIHIKLLFHLKFKKQVGFLNNYSYKNCSRMKLDIINVQKHESCLHNTCIVKFLMSWM